MEGACEMKIHDLEVIVALHEEGTLTGAAKRMGLSQPAITKRLQVVERKVQARLFNRDHDGAEITGPGRSFVEHARESVHAYHRAVHEAREAKRGERQELRIGASAYLPPALIERLRTTELSLYRNLSIEIVTEHSLELLTQLQRRKIELALVTTPPQITSVTTLRVAKYPFMIVFREGHPLAAKESVGFTELSEYPWILFNRNLHPYLHDLIVQRMEAEQRKPTIAHHFIQADQVIAFLTDNSSIAWMTPTDAKRAAQHGLRYIPLRDSQIRLETHLAALANNKSQLVSEYVRTFAKRMKDQRPPEQLSLPISA
jgi:DNA-binding transcriptional LysR family regulator